MTFREFSRWANERACDGQWGFQHVIATQEIYAVMDNTNIFNRKSVWKKQCENRAIEIVESVKRIAEELKEKI